MKKKITKFPLLKPDLQLSFYHRLQTFQHSYLAEALRSTVEKLDISKLDKELAKYVDTVSLKKLASFGIRAEVVFPVPYLLSSRPSLVGYYRLLFGFSQKEFYRVPGMSKFKRLEERNLISEETIPILPAFCQSLSQTASYMLEGGDVFSLRTVRDLQLLTLGAQLRGGQNTKLGKDAAAEVFSLIEKIIHDKLIEENPRKLVLINAAGRKVTVAFSADPDIAITESLASDIKPKVSIEIKGGTDISNIHNRIGEAEKSHQKAKARGFFEFWTIIGADVNLKKAQQESPTSSKFFLLSQLRNTSSTEYEKFCNQVRSIVGI
ncbi:MAG: XcyI family restriction endonuclease [Dehalococcoidales bacterium]